MINVWEALGRRERQKGEGGVLREHYSESSVYFSAIFNSEENSANSLIEEARCAQTSSNTHTHAELVGKRRISLCQSVVFQHFRFISWGINLSLIFWDKRLHCATKTIIFQAQNFLVPHLWRQTDTFDHDRHTLMRPVWSSETWPTQWW